MGEAYRLRVKLCILWRCSCQFQRARMELSAERGSRNPGPPTSASAQWLANERSRLRAALVEKWREERRASRGRGRRGNQDACSIATALLEELRAPPPPPPPSPRPLPAWRRVSSKKLADARLLLLLSNGGLPYPPRSPRYRCGKCDDCLAGDCGSCASCLDKPKFGGRGCRKQACSQRLCVWSARAGVSKRKG